MGSYFKQGFRNEFTFVFNELKNKGRYAFGKKIATFTIEPRPESLAYCQVAEPIRLVVDIGTNGLTNIAV